MTKLPVPISLSAFTIWVLATTVGFAVLGSAGLIWHGVVPCAFLQALALWLWNRPLSWQWFLGTALIGAPGAFVALVVAVAAGFSGIAPDAFAVGLGGAIAGTAMGVGGWLALRSRGYAAWGWIVVSGTAWMLGAGLARLVLLRLDPDGMILFQKLTGAGFGSAAASWVVGATSGGLTGLIAGVVSAAGAMLLLARIARGEQQHANNSLGRAVGAARRDGRAGG